MKVRELFSRAGVEVVEGPDVEVQGITSSSKEAGPGDLFVALRGQRADGHDFIDEALARGAGAFLVERFHPSLTGRAYGIVRDTRQVLGPLSSIFYGRPSERLCLIGVTGTNGKTTTTYLIESIMKAGRKEVGLIGTTGYRYGGKVFKPVHTTPEAPLLQRILREMVDQGVGTCVMEVSSHGLAMGRLRGSSFACGVFTNLSQDHLDFHRGMDDYFRVKASFFKDMVEPAGGISVINVEDPWGYNIALDVKGRKVTYGMERGHVRVESAEADVEGIRGIISTPMGKVPFSSSLIGRFNLYNILAAVAVAVAFDLPPAQIREGIMALKGVPGRMERLMSPRGTFVVIDYAHTPDALANVLDALTPMKKGRIITVFGCGGDRDRGKRPLMGRIASERSDLVIITSDNPRSEDPSAIAEDIRKGIEGRNYSIELDRRRAIEMALGAGGDGDIVVIAGKGHEDYQIIGDRVIPFSDVEEVRRVFSEMEGLQGVNGL